MEKTPCLLGLKRTPNKMKSRSIFRKDDLDDADFEDDWQYAHELATPKQVCQTIVDLILVSF
jgi:hypothetical protein